MIVIVTGGRNFMQRSFLYESLDKIHKNNKIDLVINGGASGADSLSTEWAIERGVDFKIIPAEWGKYGKSAGPKRNRLMLARYPEATVVAFEGGSGTNGCVEMAKSKQMNIIDLRGGV
jgi:hypothetical protein